MMFILTSIGFLDGVSYALEYKPSKSNCSISFSLIIILSSIIS